MNGSDSAMNASDSAMNGSHSDSAMNGSDSGIMIQCHAAKWLIFNHFGSSQEKEEGEKTDKETYAMSFVRLLPLSSLLTESEMVQDEPFRRCCAAVNPSCAVTVA